MTFAREGAKNKNKNTFRCEALQLVTFRFAFFVITTSLMVFVGCAPMKSRPSDVEITRPDSNDGGTLAIEPVDTAPNEVETPGSKPPETGPNEPNDGETNNIKSGKPKPLSAVSLHNKCGDILTKFVDKNGMVDYNALRRKRSEFAKLLDEFATLDPNTYYSWRKEDKIAFCINAYNLQLMRIIVDNYPIKSYRWLHVLRDWGPKSIKHIDKRIGGINKQKFIVMREEFTLKKIEQRFFREEFDEPRVFFALFHATLSGPPLRNEPYYGHKLYKQLDDQARKFLSGTKAFKIDEKKRKVYLPLMLKSKWYGKDFINKFGTDKKFIDQSPASRAVLNCITRYVSRQDKVFLERKNYSVKYMDYDWTINDG